MAESGLKRDLSLFSIIAISSGAVLGGWLAEAPYWFQLTGAGAGWIFLILAVILIPIGLAFSELTAMLPFTSSVDVWSSNAISPAAGWGTQWAFFLVQVVEPPLVAFIFITAAEYFVEIPDSLATIIVIAIMVAWYVVSNFGIDLTGRLAVLFFFAMIVITLIVSFYFFFSGHWELTNITEHGGVFPLGILGAVAGASALVLKFIGFGMTPTLIQETRFPAKSMAIVILLALFIPATVYCFATFAMAGLAPYTVIQDMALPAPELVNVLDMAGAIAILAIVAGVLYALTTLMGFWASSARVLYGSAQLNQLPHWFLKLNSHGQPYIANIVVLAFGIFFAFFTGTNWVAYIYSLSVVAAGIVYFMVCLSAYLLRDKHPEWERPYNAPYGKPVFLAGMVVSAAITIVGLTLLPPAAWFPVTVYVIIGFAIYYAMKFYRANNVDKYGEVILTPADKSKVGAVEDA